MNFSKLGSLVGRSIGIAIALYFCIHYSFNALLCISNNSSQIKVVALLAFSIAAITLIKEKVTAPEKNNCH